jgi:hypothetical protein
MGIFKPAERFSIEAEDHARLGLHSTTPATYQIVPNWNFTVDPNGDRLLTFRR